jgi:hypothetical protein
MIERDLLADHIPGAAEAPLPHAVAQDHPVVTLAVDGLRPLLLRSPAHGSGMRSDTLDRGCLLLNIEDFSYRNFASLVAAYGMDFDELVGIAERERGG